MPETVSHDEEKNTASFVKADLHQHHSVLLSLNDAYMSWLFSEVDRFFGVRCAEIVGLGASEYAASDLHRLCVNAPPDGTFYLLKRQGQFCAMGGLRRLSTDTAELKRIYVDPAFRGSRLGKT